MSTTKYVIRWSCEECGTSGEVRGDGKYDAFRRFDPLKDEHEKHSNLFFIDEGYEEEQE